MWWYFYALCFEDIWRPSRVLWATDSNVDRPPTYFASSAIIGRHFPHLFGSYFHADREYITMVRSPVDRTLSHYYYFRNNIPTSNISIVKKTQALSLSEFINSEDPELLSFFSNHQTKIFAYLDPTVVNLTEDELLNKAKDHLGRFAFVGIYENFLDSVDFCCLRFGFSPIINIPRENVTKDRKFSSDLGQELAKKLAALNEVDLEFYEFAKNFFLRQRRSLLLGLIDQNKKVGLTEAKAVMRGTNNSHDNGNFVDDKQIAPDVWGDLAVETIGVFLSGAHSGANILAHVIDLCLP